MTPPTAKTTPTVAGEDVMVLAQALRLVQHAEASDGWVELDLCLSLLSKDSC